MLHEMENHADSLGFDIKGIKMWLNVFWSEDGSIKRLVYYPKPNSKNIDFSKLTNFLAAFVQSYQFTLTANECFSHYGSASFPTHAQLYLSSG